MLAKTTAYYIPMRLTPYYGASQLQHTNVTGNNHRRDVCSSGGSVTGNGN